MQDPWNRLGKQDDFRGLDRSINKAPEIVSVNETISGVLH